MKGDDGVSDLNGVKGDDGPADSTGVKGDTDPENTSVLPVGLFTLGVVVNRGFYTYLMLLIGPEL